MTGGRDAALAAIAPTITIEPAARLRWADAAAAWRAREVLWILVWRGLKVRYKQTAIGAAWAVLQPLLTTVILTAVFGAFARVPSDGVPYVVFAYAGILPWTYFAQAVSESGASLVSDRQLVTKVYFPRFFLPLAAVVRPLVDLAVAAVIAVGMLAWFDIVPTWRLAALPAFLLLAVVTALGVGLWLAALNVRYRDVGYTIPFLVQVWMLASPVAYPVSLVPERWRALYALNPLVGAIDGVRWALLGTPAPDPRVLLVGAAVALALLLTGPLVFRRLERTFADFL